MGGLLMKHQDLSQILPKQGGVINEGGLLIEIVLIFLDLIQLDEARGNSSAVKPHHQLAVVARRRSCKP